MTLTPAGWHSARPLGASGTQAQARALDAPRCRAGEEWRFSTGREPNAMA